MQIQEQTPGRPFQYEFGGSGRLAGEVLVAFEPGGELMSFDALDIEPNGMFLVSDQLFGMGEELYISFESPEGPRHETRMEVTEVELGERPGMHVRCVRSTQRWRNQIGERYVASQNCS